MATTADKNIDAPVSETEDCGCGPDTSIPATDELPTTEELVKINGLAVLDASGVKHTFKSIYDIEGVQKHLIVFVRKFFCGSCQDYLRAIGYLIPPASLPSDTRITIIGHADSTLIPGYLSVTSCQYPVYTDPTRALYDAFHLQSTLATGPQPAYITRTTPSSTMVGIMQHLSQATLKDGANAQNGGEFLFVREGDEWTVKWAHRMKNTRDHTAITKIASVLGVKGVEKESAPLLGMKETLSAWKNASVNVRISENKTNELSVAP